jgi:Flp pilus assembly pilin Flp
MKTLDKIALRTQTFIANQRGASETLEAIAIIVMIAVVLFPALNALGGNLNTGIKGIGTKLETWLNDVTLGSVFAPPTP